MLKRSIEHSLVVAEKAIDIYLNARNESLVAYRIRKFFHHPFRFVVLIAAKIGVIKSARARTFFRAACTVPLSDVNGAALYYAGCLRGAEGYVTRFLAHTLQSDSVFYDIGANYGFYSTLALSFGSEIHAFEPSSHCMRFLKINTDAFNGRTTLNHLALSDSEGEVDFFDMSSGRKSGMSTINTAIAQASPVTYKKSVVPTITLDNYVQHHSVPTIMKIDVEGAEAKVLEGARETLRTHAPTLVVEIWGSSVGMANSRATLSLLKELGYHSYAIESDGSVRPTEINLLDIGDNNNFVFKKH